MDDHSPHTFIGLRTSECTRLGEYEVTRGIDNGTRSDYWETGSGTSVVPPRLSLPETSILSQFEFSVESVNDRQTETRLVGQSVPINIS